MDRVYRLSGTLAGCPGCAKQPRLVESRITGAFHFECQCGFRMWTRPTRQELVEDWEALPRALMPAEIEPATEPTEQPQNAAA